MKQTLEVFGAVFNLTFSLPTDMHDQQAVKESAEKLKLHINRLYNYGIISNIPVTYDETKDTTVMVQTDRGRMLKGFIAMELTAMQADTELTKQFKGDGHAFLAEVNRRAEEKIANFEQVDTVYNRSVGHEYSQGLIENLGWAQDRTS